MVEHERSSALSVRGSGIADRAGTLLVASVAAAISVLPPARLLALTSIRLAIAASLLALSWASSGWFSTITAWASHAFLLLAVLSVAAHIEGAVLGPVVDRIVGRGK